jgi:uncharacterized protein YaaN involved in tellurite resistance
MSRDFDNIMKKITESNKDIQGLDKDFNKEFSDIKKSIKNLTTKIDNVESKINDILAILNSFTIMLAEEDEEDDSDPNWTPYDNYELDGDDDGEDYLDG